MAVKDHTLDEKIIRSATAEFMTHGFQKASLHKIAAGAGLTTGALYTRYKNKDALFCSLVNRAIEKIKTQFEPMRENYVSAQMSGSVDELLAAIRREEKIYLDLLFCYYDECVLFFCRSAGSSIEVMLNEMMEQKAAHTVEFLKSISKREIDLDGVEFIMAEQFQYYRQILQRGYTKEKAISCMETVELFLEAGWKALFERIL